MFKTNNFVVSAYSFQKTALYVYIIYKYMLNHQYIRTKSNDWCIIFLKSFTTDNIDKRNNEIRFAESDLTNSEDRVSNEPLNPCTAFVEKKNSDLL